MCIMTKEERLTHLENEMFFLKKDMESLKRDFEVVEHEVESIPNQVRAGVENRVYHLSYTGLIMLLTELLEREGMASRDGVSVTVTPPNKNATRTDCYD